MTEPEENRKRVHRKFKILDPITHDTSTFDVCAEVTDEQVTSVTAIGIDMNQKIREAMLNEARQASTQKYFESIRNNAKELVIELNDDEHIWSDFYGPIIDTTMLMKEPVIFCNCTIRNIMMSVPTNFKVINYGTIYSKETIQLRDREVMIITDNCKGVHDYNVLLYDKKNKRLAVNILFINNSTETDLFIVFENHRHQRMINIL